MTRVSDNKFFRLSLVLLTAFVTLLIFSPATSPLYPDYYGYDSAFFMLVGMGMKKGMLPYRDFFDMKGPVLFLIEYIGQLFADGRTGAFIIQFINLCLVFLIAYKMIELAEYKNKHWFLIFIMCFVIYASCAEGGNLTEEFSLVPLFICLYLALKYYFNNPEKSCGHNPEYAFIYGISFSLLAMIRITNAALICGIVFSITLNLLFDKNYKNLAFNAAAFIAGAILAFLPFYIYYSHNGIIKDMLYQVFMFGFEYAKDPSQKGLARFITRAGILFSLFIPVITSWLFRKQNKRLILFAIICSFAAFAGCIIGNSYRHYYMLVMPMAVGGIVIYLKYKNEQTKPQIKKAAKAVLILAFVFILPYMYTATRDCNNFLHNSTVTDEIKDIAKNIPEDERDSVLAFNAPTTFYAVTEIFPQNRYCAWQSHYIEIVPKIENELVEAFRNDAPKWIVVNRSQGLPEFIEQTGQKYDEKYTNNSYILFHCNAE